MRAIQTIATVPTKEGLLELRLRGESDFLLVIGGRVLMTSAARRSEEALGTLACAKVTERAAPRVLVGGLGMGFTLRAALDALPRDARITVVEITAEVVDWCRGILASLSRQALADSRVTVEVGDVRHTITRAPAGAFDAILLDLFEGPHAAGEGEDDPWYGRAALLRTRRALTTNGVLAVWSEDADPPFVRRLADVGFEVAIRREGRGGRAHVVYLATRVTRRGS